MKSAFWVSLLCVLPALALANEPSRQLPYYGEAFYQELAQGSRDNTQLVASLRTILKSAHKPKQGGFDQILDSCKEPSCYRHVTLGYNQARIFMMGQYYLIEKGNSYALPDLYCGKIKTANEFPSNPPAPNKIPLGTVLNTEHTWPQSRFNTKFDIETQKSDIHHLYPVDTQLNSIRGNNEFGEVVKETKPLKCGVSHFGKPAKGNNDVFEPPHDHKGNVARALFYFSVNYDLPISPEQEAALRKWHIADPVDAEEAERNEEIFKIQKNRNPFIDHPELVDQISNF